MFIVGGSSVWPLGCLTLLDKHVRTERRCVMNISSLDQANLPACVSLFINVFNQPPWNEHWHIDGVQKRLEDCYHTPGFYGLVARNTTDVLGFVAGYVEQWDTSKHYFLKEMCVARAYQRHGDGTTLMQTLDTQLHINGVERIYLLTARDGTAQAFYQTCGFYVSPKMILMAKRLPLT